eukprot:symbB.v1.2.019993.t1/scaffold1657.1/size107422/2
MEALSLLATLLQRSMEATVMTYNVAMSACERWRDVFLLWEGMRQKDVEANVISFNVLLSVGTSWRCSQLCLEEMLSRRLERTAVTFEYLLRIQHPGTAQLLGDLRETAMVSLVDVNSQLVK